MSHDADKLIRQLSLVAYLMAEQRPVTARDVKTNVEGYANMGDEAFARRYYADRTELLGLGVPIAGERDEFTGEELYNLREEQYFLPPIDLSDDELAALLNSFYLLEGQFAYAEPLRLALQNLALGRALPRIDPGPKTATVDLLGAAYSPDVAQRLAKLEQAISKQRTVRFTYWTIGSDREAVRTVNPYGLYELNGVWYMVGDDREREADDARRTFRISRMRGEITFATRRERDFRIPADFQITGYRDRPPWMLDPVAVGEAMLAVDADTTFFIERLYGRHGTLEEFADGSARFTTPYSSLEALTGWMLSLGGRVTAVAPAAVADAVRADLEAVAAAHAGAPSLPQVVEPTFEPVAAESTRRGPGPVAPERFALLQAMLAYLLASCGEEQSARVASSDLRSRFALSSQELQEHLDLLNLVNFGGGCYAVYCATENGHVLIDKELYGDTFRRPARLSPLEAKALLRALDVVAPLVAAEAHSSLETVRGKIEAAFGRFTLGDTPTPSHPDAVENAVTVLNEGTRQHRLVEITYLSRSSNELSSRTIEPYLLRRDERGWYAEAYDRSRGGRRTFKVAYIRDADLLEERFEPRAEMDDLAPRLGGEVGIARVLFDSDRARWELEGRPGAQAVEGGGAIADIAFASRSWLIPEILRYRGQAQVLEPAALREAVRSRAEHLLEAAGAAVAS